MNQNEKDDNMQCVDCDIIKEAPPGIHLGRRDVAGRKAYAVTLKLFGNKVRCVTVWSTGESHVEIKKAMGESMATRGVEIVSVEGV